MKVGTIIAITGALLAMILAFANLGMYLIWQPNKDWVVFVLLMAIAAGVGALPGLVIGWLRNKGGSGRNDPPT